MTPHPYTDRKILVTGASGFIGSFIVEKALDEGMEVWAAVRKNSSRRYLQDSRIRFVELTLEDEATLREQIRAHCAEHGAWHYVVHAAGATKCKHNDDFFKVNTQGTLHLAATLLQEKALLGRFVFISSLSVMGAIREQQVGGRHGEWHYAPIEETDTPQPNTAYGRSKLQAEQGLAALEGLDYVVLRPTGVYGPRERDYFLMAKSIVQHVDFAVGYRPQELTFIYVKDLADAVVNALIFGKRGKAYFLTDGEVYHSRTFSDLLQQELGVRGVLHIKAPLWVLRVVSIVAERWARCRGKSATLNTDKYKIMKQRNWQCNIGAACVELHYTPQYTLEKGVKEAVEWYKKEKWL